MNHVSQFTGATVIHHDSEHRRLAISEINVAPDEASYIRPVTYRAPMDHIIALMELSNYCLQFIKWECHNAPIWADGNIVFVPCYANCIIHINIHTFNPRLTEPLL